MCEEEAEEERSASQKCGKIDENFACWRNRNNVVARSLCEVSGVTASTPKKGKKGAANLGEFERSTPKVCS